MKKLLSLTLATLMLSASAVSCAPSEQLDPAITLASSDAYGNAEWLDKRLDVIPDDVVIGVGSNAAYGIDMSDFESDGYIVREVEGDVLIFGASTDGLDRAVRAYAKAADINQTANLDEVYHEGPRVKRLTVAGQDISEFTVCYPADDKNIQSAAATMQKLVNQACGVTVPVSSEPTEGASVEFSWVTDEALGYVGSRYTVSEGKIRFECSDAYKAYSASWAVIRFLENELDWFGLSSTENFLPESEWVDIPAGASSEEVHVFNELTLNSTSGNPLLRETYPAYYTGSSYSFSPIVHACHGLSNNKIATEFSKTGNWASDLPCFLDDDFYAESLKDVTEHIENKLNAGQIIGETFFRVDISAGDNHNFCICDACAKLYKNDNRSHSAAVVTWANRLSEELSANERYRGLIYQIFAYTLTTRPPRRTAPNEWVYVTFAPDHNCAVHSFNGVDCTGDPVDQPYKGQDYTRSNYVMSRDLEGWLRLTPNVDIWTYNYGDALMSISYVHTVYEDFKYYRDVGIKGIYWNSYDQGYGANYFCRFLWGELQWNGDITDEEYEALYERALQCFYGDSWENVKEYFALQTENHLAATCSSCWWWDMAISPTLNMEFYSENYDYMYDILEEAIPLAASAKEACRLESFQCSNIYKGTIMSYFQAYNAYDDERCAELEERYNSMYDRMMQYGVDITVNHGSDMTAGKVDPDMVIQMWTSGYATLYIDKWYHYDITREMPERAAEYIESVEAEEAAAATATE